MPKRHPVGLHELAVLFGVAEATPSRWLYRTRTGLSERPFPEPDFTVSKDTPCWYPATVERIARVVGRPADWDRLEAERATLIRAVTPPAT